MRIAMSAAVSLPLCIILQGCQKYQARPLVPHDTVMSVERSRHLLLADNPSADSPAIPVPFTFSRAAELMQAHSPALKEAWAEYESSAALAKIKTSLPNPALEIGPNYGFGPDVSALHRLQPFGSLGFSIPTGGRLKRQDELNRSRAERARVEALVRQRELYLELRELYSRLMLARARVELRRNIAASSEKSVALMKKLVEAGNATALDVGLLELEAARARMDLLSARSDIASIEGSLSALIGVHAEQFAPLPEPALPAIPASVPDIGTLRQTLVLDHPGLARLRADYEIAERELRLEIAKQYPDFQFGPSFEREPGERKTVLGLTLGIELPAFDRNQQAIAQATKHREQARIAYEAAANRALANLDLAWSALNLANEKAALLKEVVLPQARANLALAQRSLQAGALDSLRVLDTERSQRAALIDALDSELSVREAWIRMEQAVGRPLMLFPSEKPERQPPAGNEARDETSAEDVGKAGIPSETPELEKP